MDSTTRLLERHQRALRERRVLVVGAEDPGLAAVAGPGAHLFSDNLGLAGAEASLVPRVDPETDLIVFVMPKSRERLRFWLAAAAGAIRTDTEVWLVGASRGGVRGGATDLAGVAGPVQSLDSARHCKLYRGWLRPQPFDAAAWVSHWRCDGLTLTSYPGVFSHGRLDDGTRLLLDALRDRPLTGSALELGSGAGVLCAWLARRGLRVTAVDQSAAAVAATRATLAANGLEGEVLGSDLCQAVSGRFDLIVTNPPFHEGVDQTLGVTRRLIAEAPDRLRENGELWLVANQGLPYRDWLRAAFGRLEVAAENTRFRVWQAGSPRRGRG